MEKKINSNPTCIEIQGNWLTSSYSVYLVIITRDKDQFYYVGQTGDAKWISARSPFYRLAAHLGYGKSTQNQIYDTLQKKLKKNKEEMEQWLSNATIKIHSFKTDDFIFPKNDKKYNANEKETHTKKRRRTLALESAIIQQINIANKSLLNKAEVTWQDWEYELSKDYVLSDALNIFNAICKS